MYTVLVRRFIRKFIRKLKPKLTRLQRQESTITEILRNDVIVSLRHKTANIV